MHQANAIELKNERLRLWKSGGNWLTFRHFIYAIGCACSAIGSLIMQIWTVSNLPPLIVIFGLSTLAFSMVLFHFSDKKAKSENKEG